MTNTPHDFPSIYQMVEEGLIPYADYALVKLLLKDVDDVESGLFILKMMEALREGNLSYHSVTPPNLPENVVTETEPGAPIPSTPICRIGNHFYFQKYWKLEETFFSCFKEFFNQDPLIGVQPPNLDNLPLLPEQKLAIQQGCASALTMITGGPGTGKTYTAGWLIRILIESLSKEQRANFKIALTAPTGKAATNLQGSLEKAFQGLDLPDITAKTLHSLLHISSWSMKREKEPLPYDLILVDECSMVDAKLMATLFSAIHPGSRLILLGDPYQLPPVDAGGFFREMADLVGSEHSVVLTSSQRVENSDLLLFAKAVAEGSVADALKAIEVSSHLQLSTFDHSPGDVQKKAVQFALENFPSPLYLGEESLDTYLSLVQKYRILSPLRQGTLGVETMNKMIYEQFLEIHSSEALMIPIIISSNDYKQKLFNGEVGVLVQTSSVEDNFAYINGRKIPAILLPRYEWAWALSIHKSQGSEFDHLLLLLPEGSQKFSRELLYTGITRAKKSIDLWVSPGVFEQVVEKQSQRSSEISKRSLKSVESA
ncbi:MAG: exodeoxyribonuclease V subunit alpha [Waddliaceae bacterium]